MDPMAWKLVVPGNLAEKLIQIYHERFGNTAKENLGFVKKHFFLQKLEKKVSQVIGRCDLCQKTKVGNVHNEGKRTNNQAQKPMEQVFVDIAVHFHPVAEREADTSNVGLRSLNTPSYTQWAKQTRPLF